MSAPLLQARKGGALYPVLMIAGILLILSSMVPQVLVTASHAMRNDLTRDQLLMATESGIAVAEAKLKQDIGHALMASATPSKDAWVVKPSYDNPDYGHKADYTYEVKLVDLKFQGISMQKDREIFTFGYRLWAKGTHVKKDKSMELGVSGLVVATMSIDTSGSGIASKVLDDIKVYAFNREL